MPQVPVFEAEQRLRPVTNERFRAPDNRAGEIFAEGLKDLGGAVAQTGQNIDETQAIYDSARAKALDNEYQTFERDALFGENGFYNHQNEAALNARDPTQEAIAKKQGELLAKTQSARERKMLSDVFERRKQEAFDGIARYAGAQAHNFAITQSEARISNAQNNYVLYAPGDAKRGEMERSTILGETAQLAQLRGLEDADVIRALRDDNLSTMHSAMAEKLMLDDPVGASAYVEKNRAELTPKAQLSLDAQLRPLLVDHDAQLFADQASRMGITAAPITTNVPGAEPGVTQATSDTNAVWARMIHAESRGRQSAVSKKGAIGIAQVMPDTAREMARELGVPFDEGRYKGDATYNEMLGKAYFAKMLRRFRGDVPRAVAAYNAGPGGVDKAVAKGVNWRDHLPDETRGYLKNVLGEAGGDAHGVVTSTQNESSLKAQLDWVEAYIPEKLAGKPPAYVQQVVEHTKAEIRQRYTETQAIQRDAENTAWEGALESVFALGDRFTDIKQIPGWQKLPVERRISLQDTASANRNARAKATETDWGYYSNLFTKTPEQLRTMDVAEARQRLGDTEFKEFAKMRQDKGDPGKALTFSDILAQTKLSLGAAGYSVGESKDGRKDAPQVNAFLRSMKNWADGIHAQTGKWPPADAIRKQGDRFLIEGTWTEPGFLGERHRSGHAFEAKQSVTASGFHVEVPDDIRASILKAIPNATERQVREAYIAGKGIDW